MTDEQAYKLHREGVPVWLIAESAKTSRGHVYNKIMRYKDPDRFYARVAKYEEKRFNTGAHLHPSTIAGNKKEK